MAELKKIDLGSDMMDRQVYPAKINIRVLRADTGEVLYTGHNIIVNVVKWLFARLMANAPAERARRSRTPLAAHSRLRSTPIRYTASGA